MNNRKMHLMLFVQDTIPKKTKKTPNGYIVPAKFGVHFLPCMKNVPKRTKMHLNYTPNGYIVPMEFRVHFFARISAFSRRTKMDLNGMLLIGTDFFQNYSSFVAASNLLVKSKFFQIFATRE